MKKSVNNKVSVLLGGIFINIKNFQMINRRWTPNKIELIHFLMYMTIKNGLKCKLKNLLVNKLCHH